MNWAGYARVWRVPSVRRAILLGFLTRVAIFGLGVALTLHGVLALGGTYVAAGLVSGVLTVAVGVASPYRGRLLDTRGLRRTLLPSLLVLPFAYAAVPFVSYPILLALMLPVGALSIPIFSVVRQVLVASVSADDRRTAISLDSVATELCFMAGPALAAVVAAWDSRVALLLFGAFALAGGWLLYAANPPLRREDEVAAPAAAGQRWLTLRVVGIFAAVFAAGVILAGTDISVVAALRSFGLPAAVGIVLAVWGLGSAVGGALYGALHRTVPLAWLAVGLAALTIPVALAGDAVVLALLLVPAGVFCAPAIAAASDDLAAAVPAGVLGEAMGWQGTMMMAGSALSPPAIGWTIDHLGWRSGFVVAGVAGLTLAVVLMAAVRSRRAPQRVGP